MILAEFDMHDGKHVTVTKHDGGYSVTVNGTLVQEGDAEDMIRYLAHHAHNAYHVAARVGEVVYQVEGYCPTEPDDTSLEREDGGAALIFHPSAFATKADQEAGKFQEEDEFGMFVRVQSYDERIWERNGADPNAHAEIRRLFGKRVRVTVEVLDD